MSRLEQPGRHRRERRPGSARRSAWLVAAVGFALLESGCGSLAYTTRVGFGGARMLAGGRPVSGMVADPSLDPELRDRLEMAIEVRDFAFDVLGLPDNGSFSRYKDLGRPFAVWTVVAAPEFSLEPRIWCFPVAGCVSYRGYFSRQRATRYAASLRRRGWEVSVSGVRAFSTLGRFRDPLLNTFVGDSHSEVAELVFHELAHQVAYVKDDSAFNEGFASFVAERGVVHYLEETGRLQELELFSRRERRRRETRSLLVAAREELADLYRSSLTEPEMRAEKREIFSRLDERLRTLREGSMRALNNADLASLETYSHRRPAFEALFRESGGSFRRFFDRVRQLAATERSERDRLLEGLIESGSG